jgi:molecular chaperone GrpE
MLDDRGNMDNRNTPVDTSADDNDSAAQTSEDAASFSSGGRDTPEGSEGGGAVAAERDRLADQVAELTERLLRLRADYENFRRRAERERAEVFDIAGMETARALVPVLDDFERALSVAAAGNDDGPLREYAKGMELIYQRLSDALTKLGLQAIEAAGQPFDPNLHHAVQMEQRDDVEDHTVLEQYQRGYNFKGKLLRAAMVKVAVKP